MHGAELEAIAESQGVEIEPGDAVAVYCGREEWSRRHGPWGGMTGAGSLPSAGDERPGLHASCLRFLRETDTAVLVWDMMDLTPYGLAIPWAGRQRPARAAVARVRAGGSSRVPARGGPTRDTGRHRVTRQSSCDPLILRLHDGRDRFSSSTASAASGVQR